MMLIGKVGVFLVGLLQYLANKYGLLVRKFSKDFFLSKSVFGYFKT